VETPEVVGIMGCGKISGRYIETLSRSRLVAIGSCADRDPERAKAAAELAGARAATPEQLLDEGAVGLVLNLTPPLAHAAVATAALEAGKHVYGEKPLAVERRDAEAVLDAARARDLRVGTAPDTFFGSAWQTARAAVDEGLIGRPVAARAAMLTSGHESWHPDPDIFYTRGGGPLLDMGPYYFTALVMLLGPIRRVTGAASAAFTERTIGSGRRAGERVPVETATHVAAIAELESDVVVSLLTSFDVDAEESSFELFGAEGTLQLPDPNDFDGPVLLRTSGSERWRRLAPRGTRDLERGVGLLDLVVAQREGRPPRASGDLALHVLDAMLGTLEAAEEGSHVELTTRCDRPEPLALGEVEEWLDVR